VGHRITDLKPIHGFCAETTAATALTAAAALGFPVSTTHTITAAVGGVGASRRFSALRATVINHILLAWVFTFPCAGLLAYLVSRILGK
jgi:PiT family inorganic phosphate transporter